MFESFAKFVAGKAVQSNGQKALEIFEKVPQGEHKAITDKFLEMASSDDPAQVLASRFAMYGYAMCGAQWIEKKEEAMEKAKSETTSPEKKPNEQIVPIGKVEVHVMEFSSGEELDDYMKKAFGIG